MLGVKLWVLVFANKFYDNASFLQEVGSFSVLITGGQVYSAEK